MKDVDEVHNCVLSILTNTDSIAFKEMLQSHYGVEIRLVSDSRYAYCVKDIKDLPSALESMYLTLSKVKTDDEPEQT